MFRNISQTHTKCLRLMKSMATGRITSQSNPPVVVVLGATGAGKSKLALEIAEMVDGEIVSADSMQVYEGLDIITNKVTKEELEVCPHHMIGITSPLQEFTAVHFRNQVLPIIDDIHARGKIPVIAGGTNYYVEGIIWDQLVQSSSDSEDDENFRQKLYNETSEVLHERLKEVDPKTAELLHPNDKRKIVNALHTFEKTKIPLSEHHSKQQKQGGGGGYGGPLRFPNTCMLWVQCEPEVLFNRVRSRVDKMLKRGLLKELEDFHRDFNAERVRTGEEANYERGIFQSIGFKEFHEYLIMENTKETEYCRALLLRRSIEKMNVATWKYAKYQVKWIKKRMLRRSNALPIYPLDGSDPTNWDDMVRKPALLRLKNFFADNPQISERLAQEDFEGVKADEALPAVPLEKNDDGRRLQACPVCKGLMVQVSCWEAHLRSKKHRYHLKLRRKLTESFQNLNEQIEKEENVGKLGRKTEFK